MVEQLKNFIEANHLEFTEGRRNSDLVPLVGYALYLKNYVFQNVNAYPNLESVLEEKIKKDDELKNELNNVFDYAENANYENWWEHKSNREKYKGVFKLKEVTS